MIKKTLKSFFKPVYQRSIRKLREGLQTDEQFRLLNHIVEQNIQLKHDVKILQHEINMLNILVGGIESQKGTDAFAITPEDTARDIINILAPQNQQDVTIVQLLNHVGPDIFKGKSVCLIGAGTAFFRKELERRGAEVTINIEMNPLITNGHDMQNSNMNYVYPSQIQTIDIPTVDIVMIAHPAAASYLLKRKLMQIGAKVKEKGYFLLHGTEPQRQHLATLITGSGFAQTRGVPDGTAVSFDYMELRELPKKEISQGQETVLYEATKLPSMD